ncbi:dnaJ homolog subfamily C member 9 [Diaphorina citri]|uniref:DnaJ homolog subfamily C member 9 n=1 Tax=Diaphorina citri TaxID=121845 RepID=A0A1S3DQG4_DIACI|nr:dnaJ homolog subfamily C member 9 [Diaphorina citri]KAI5698148.1 hypothetical protein M8J75_002351 [Diaphorina citri]KAI5727935.1 hypothetical protein M8J77_008855 [Diaphorina citri]
MKGLLQLCEKYYKTKDLYEVLNVDKTATPEQIRKAFYKLSLVVHPDRVTEEDKEVATEKFKILGLVHSILSDVEKRKVYDQTGTLEDEDDEAIFKSDIDWTMYWKSLYKDVTEEDIINYETKYKGSAEEINDFKRAYVQGEGDMDLIFELVPFTHPSEEDRYRQIIQDLIDKEEVPAFDKFLNEAKSKRNRRKRKFEKEEKLFEKEKAKDERRKKSGVRNSGADSSMDLIAAIQSKNANRESMFNGLIANLEAKYGGESGKKETRRQSGRKK